MGLKMDETEAFDSLSDRECVRKFQKGNVNAFEILIAAIKKQFLISSTGCWAAIREDRRSCARSVYPGVQIYSKVSR